MKNKTTRFLIASVLLASLVCVGLFTMLASFMNSSSSKAISEVGKTYMQGMSEQISLHFETAINLRLRQVESIVEEVPMAEDSGLAHDMVQEQLRSNGKACDFNYLGLVSEQGDFEMAYGEKLKIIDPESFLTSMKEGKEKVAVGTDLHGNKVILFGVPAQYCMEDGSLALALVAGLPVEYITDTLSLDINDSKVYSFIVKQDGSFVIRTNGAFRENYFERARNMYEDTKDGTVESYIQEMGKAMEEGRDYSRQISVEGKLRHVYCTKLSYSEWYLLTFMPYGTLDATIDHFSHNWGLVSVLGCAIVLGILLIIFLIYFRMTRRQMCELYKARTEAEHATQAKSEFLSNMSHDIRTPMNAIVGMTAIAMANADDMGQVQNCLKKIALSSKHLLGLINDVLDMSKIESGKMTLSMDLVSLREVMDSIVSIVQPQTKAKRQKFDVFIYDIISENVYCDGVRLNQILLNILSNAIKFTPDEGKVEISLHEEPVENSEQKVRVHIHVKDSGIGIAPEFKDKIFDSFSREETRVRRTEGSGLGMAITKYIIDAMGGTIEMDSELGVGTEFHVILELEKADTPEEEMVLPPWNMLVVDDDEQLCESAVVSLKSFGVNAEWALDGETALEMVETKKNSPNSYEVILLDWKLPGMDGIQIAKKIRSQLEDDVPILLISAYDWSEIERQAREAGINGFISKPLFKSTLYCGLRAYAGEGEELVLNSVIEPKVDFKGKRILVAEDNDLNWEIAEALLEDLELTLERAENGQECVDKFKETEQGYYDGILMDIRMPIMTGYEAAKAIRAMDREDSDLPIIAMTADAFAEDVEAALHSGMNAHVSKPIDIRELQRLLEKFIK
ncbi:MAG: response regulator [Firmicutes bacterium]|nr:response regulator [Bacillota bacterium]